MRMGKEAENRSMHAARKWDGKTLQLLNTVRSLRQIDSGLWSVSTLYHVNVSLLYQFIFSKKRRPTPHIFFREFTIYPFLFFFAKRGWDNFNGNLGKMKTQFFDCFTKNALETRTETPYKRPNREWRIKWSLTQRERHMQKVDRSGFQLSSKTCWTKKSKNDYRNVLP